MYACKDVCVCTNVCMYACIMLYATVTSRLPTGTAWLTAKRYKAFPMWVKYRSTKTIECAYLFSDIRAGKWQLRSTLSDNSLYVFVRVNGIVYFVICVVTSVFVKWILKMIPNEISRYVFSLYRREVIHEFQLNLSSVSSFPPRRSPRRVADCIDLPNRLPVMPISLWFNQSHLRLLQLWFC
jgi:hypothetical protein